MKKKIACMLGYMAMAIWWGLVSCGSVAAAPSGSVGLGSNGEIIVIGGIVSGITLSTVAFTAVAAGSEHVVGLEPDGTVVAEGDNAYGQCDVSTWNEIIAIAANYRHTIGLKSDGTVKAAGNNDDGQCEVSFWNDIEKAAAGWHHTLGVKTDGTVVAAGNNDDGQCEVSSWSDIIRVTAGGAHSVGLKADGTVVATGNDDYGQCDVSAWNDIIEIAAGYRHTLGLRFDGTVVSAGNDDDGQCDVSSWSNIKQVSAGYNHSLGIKTDGTVVAAGNNNDGQCNVSSWSDIIQVIAGGGDGGTGSKPDAPALTVTNQDSFFTVSWTSVSDADGYTLFFAPYPEGDPISSVDMGTKTTVSVSLDGGSAYYVAVQANNSYGDSELSDIIQAVASGTNSTGTKPYAPTLTITQQASSFTLYWTSVSDADGYKLFFAPYPEGDPIENIDMGSDTTAVLPFDLDENYFAVKAYNSYGDSEFSNIEYFIYSSYTCGAYVAPGVWKEFACYNLAAIGKTTGDDPFTPSWRLIGGYWQWGRKGPGSSQWYDTNTKNFAHGPTGSGSSDANAGTISDWDVDYAPDDAWSALSKTANDPCPSGYRVPTMLELYGLANNNTMSVEGAWNDDPTNYSGAAFFGSELMLPAAGVIESFGGNQVIYRGLAGYYWSSDVYGDDTAWLLVSNITTSYGKKKVHDRRNGLSVRCIKE